MPTSQLPPAMQAGAPSPVDAFHQYVTHRSMIPMWLDSDVAGHVLQHFGRDGRAVVHPHPSLNVPKGFAQGGVVFPMIGGGGTAGAQLGNGPAMATPAHMGGAAGMGTFPSAMGAPANVGKALGGIRGGNQSIFSGGPMGAGGPTDRTPIFAQNGGALDGTAGGQVPGVDVGKDTVPAMLTPGEAVFNKQQLAGIQPKQGKTHLLRADQKKAIRGAAKRGRK